MKEWPLVSIITPSYNQGQFIEQTIQSVLGQNYPKLEYIVVDGGSTDCTLDILKKYDGQLIWISEKDRGQADAINKGFRMAKGEIVAWLNSDDVYADGAIHKAVDYFLNHKDVALVYGDADIIDAEGRFFKKFEFSQPFDLWTLIHLHDYIVQPATFFKRDAISSIGYLDESLNWCMDWDLWIRLALRYEVSYIKSVLASSREYEITKTSTGGKKRLKEILSLMRKYSGEKYPPGYFIYLASSIYIQNKSIPIIGFLARSVLYIVHRRIVRSLPIKYLDNWMGRKLAITVPWWYNRICIEGDVPLKEVLPLTLTVLWKGTRVFEQTISKQGAFSLEFPLDFNHDTVYSIVLSSNHYVISSKVNTQYRDFRRLSCKINRVTFTVG